MDTQIALIRNLHRDNRTTPERQAAKHFNVSVASEATEVHETYGSKHSYAQVWWTACGKALIISCNDENISAALHSREFDWKFDPYSADVNYRNIATAAGL